jgi:hypothetical protein
MPKFIFLIIVIFFTHSWAIAQVRFAQTLSENEQLAVVQAIGLNAYQGFGEDLSPLGGYSGFYLHGGLRSISLNRLRDFSNNLSTQNNLNYLDVGFSKGLYYDIDIQFSFIPKIQSTNLSGFGGAIRWTWLNLPEQSLLGLISASGRITHLESRISFITQTLDILLQKNWQNFYAFSGISFISSNGQFIGGNDGLTLSGTNENQGAQANRLILGVGLKQNRYNIGIDIGTLNELNFLLKSSVELD